MCVARLRVAVGAGIWRANHKTLGAWAERAYPEGHLLDNGHGAAAAEAGQPSIPSPHLQTPHPESLD